MHVSENGTRGGKTDKTQKSHVFIKTIKSYQSYITVSEEEKKYAVIRVGVLYGDEY